MAPRKVVVLSQEPDERERFSCLVDGHGLMLGIEDIKRYVAGGAVLQSA